MRARRRRSRSSRAPTGRCGASSWTCCAVLPAPFPRRSSTSSGTTSPNERSAWSRCSTTVWSSRRGTACSRYRESTDMHALVAFFDDEADKKVRDLWRRIGSRHDYPPHLTYAIASTIGPKVRKELREDLERLW